MMKDFKFLRRNSGKNPNNIEEIENVPVNPRDSTGSHTSTDSSMRPPLNTIQEPVKDMSARLLKIDRTPTKPNYRPANSTTRTPERQGNLLKGNRFGWAHKGDLSTNGVEEGRGDVGQLRNVANATTPRSIRTVGRANSECNSTQSTPTKSVSKPPNPGFCLASGSRMPANGSARMASFAALSKGVPVTCNSSTIVNTVEVPHFELKEDPAFWMEHNVQVLIRVRPLNNIEMSTYGYTRCLKQESAQSLTWIGQPETRFTFDHVACETVDQETLFRMVGLPMVENCLSGYNSCVFAYGQTGSGKTFTMLGEIEDLEIKPSPNRGMTPRIFEFLFARIRAEEESRRDERLKYNCKCSFLEIYNEQITDLLDPSSTNLLLREDMKNGVYVENLSEIEVHTVGDILKLLSQGSSNRKVAATNMNRESSRSHSVFTCIIESRWEKDSTSNFRFARLNLVDLAGSERQKSSGAEGERLKEAASINKSLSTLGHVIMVLVDVAHGKTTRHIPYRDSRLTFLLQDSLGGNSKTMIIANVSPSICCAAETLNTLKFAQRAKLIQNNAVVNEDSSGDIAALQYQIQLLKEEVSALRHQNVSRSLSFGPSLSGQIRQETSSAETFATDQQNNLFAKESKGVLRVSTKQLKSLETTLAGALRREQMAETSMEQLRAEIEQLNRLVRQREEDNRCSKMMLKFREDKIQRMESLLGGLMPGDTYLLEENSTLREEIQLLRTKVDKNPEVTRFALENIRLLEQLRRFQDFYEEGEREMLLTEVSELRDQLLLFLDVNTKQLNPLATNTPSQGAELGNRDNTSLRLELEKTLQELEECRTNLDSCLEKNAQLRREIEEFHASEESLRSEVHCRENCVELIKESIVEAKTSSDQSPKPVVEDTEQTRDKSLRDAEEVIDLQLELDILKIILKEEKSNCGKLEEGVQLLKRDLELAKEKELLYMQQCEDINREFKEAKAIIEALESQQILSINEIEDLRNSNSHYAELLHQQALELSSLKEQNLCQDLQDLSSGHGNEPSALQEKMRKMHDSLEKAKRLNKKYQIDRNLQASSEEEIEEVRRQVEAETAEVIVSLQEELALLQQEVRDGTLKEIDIKERLASSDDELKKLKEQLSQMAEDNRTLCELIDVKESELRFLTEEWELLMSELEDIFVGGNDSLKDASNHLEVMSTSIPQKRSWISDNFGRMTKFICEKDLLIKELSRSLEDAVDRKNDMECMLRSLKGATLVINEAHQQEISEKDEEILLLAQQLEAKTSEVADLGNRIKHVQGRLAKASVCATVAFVIVKRFSELNSLHLDALKGKDIQIQELTALVMEKDAALHNQALAIVEARRDIQSLKMGLELSENSCSRQDLQHSDQQKNASMTDQQFEELEVNFLTTREKLMELQDGVAMLNLCVSEYPDGIGSPDKDRIAGISPHDSSNGRCDVQTGFKMSEGVNYAESFISKKMASVVPEYSAKACQSLPMNIDAQESLASRSTTKNVSEKNATISLLKKEIESSLQSLKGVQREMVKLRNEKEEARMSERSNCETIESLTAQLAVLNAKMGGFDEEFLLKMDAMNHKLRKTEETLQAAFVFWFQQRELHEAELAEAKEVAAQKTIEASCILAKFEEVQYTMKDADIMINELMIANETLKIEIKDLKQKEMTSISEREILMKEVQCLQSSNDLMDQQREKLEKDYQSGIVMMKGQVLEAENLVSQMQTTFMEDWASVASNFLDIKSQLQDSSKQMRDCLEEIWSDIITKDCALSVLHLCHMGILLETVTGLNAENSLLQHGVCKSDAVISELTKNNSKSMRELEMCRVLKGKLLSDIKSSFDRISRKEDQAGELTIKLNAFEKQILDLQFQEELMLQRSNNMGSELAVLMREIELNENSLLASLLDHERLLKDNEEFLKCQEESFITELSEKDFGLLIMSSELEQMIVQKPDLEDAQMRCCNLIENFKETFIICTIDALLTDSVLLEKDAELSCLQKEVEGAKKEQQDLLHELEERDSTITALQKDIQSLHEIAVSRDTLKGELGNVIESNTVLSLQVQKLESDCLRLVEDAKMKDVAIETSSRQISELDQQNHRLQNDISLLHTASYKLQKELELKDAQIKRVSCLEEENDALQNNITKMKIEYGVLCHDLENKRSELESAFSSRNSVDMEKISLQHKISSLENHIADLQTDLNVANAELFESQLSGSVVKEVLVSKIHDLQSQVDRMKYFDEEHGSSQSDLRKSGNSKCENLSAMSPSNLKDVDLLGMSDIIGGRLFHAFSDKIVQLENMFQDICRETELTSRFSEALEALENLSEELTSETVSLHAELVRKDEILKGLHFDLTLLQESASRTQDQKDEIEKLVGSVSNIEKEMELKSRELDAAVAKGQALEAQLQEKITLVSALELEILKDRQCTESLSSKNEALIADLKDAFEAKKSMEKELNEKRRVIEDLEKELEEMGTTLCQLNRSVDCLNDSLDAVISERDALSAEILTLKKELEMVQALAEENEAIALEAQEMAERKKVYAESKEEEVKLLERSVEELECTINVLEDKVEIIKGEAERQRLQREELELELHAIKQQMLNVEGSDADFKRHMEEKEKNLEEALQRMQILERQISSKDAEIAQCKAHISELNIYAEAQAREYKQKFKALEKMVEQVKSDVPINHGSNSASNKLEKNASKSRGSGSPFKCIGMGLVQQIKSERDEELSAGRHRIEELEALAASRQKEIFLLNARLAAAESMTHDVIRDLLGLKLDMKGYATLLDNQQVEMLTEKARLHTVEAQVKDQELCNLKEQLNEFIVERKGWLEEIERKQAELLATQVAIEKLRQREQQITTENEMLKMENVNHKKRVMELESDVKKLSGQQNLQQRIHHHAKIKEENNSLKSQNENLCAKLRKTESILSRVKEEIAHFRAANGRSPYISFDTEQQLENKLKESEEERLQLAEKLVGLCTSILKAAGFGQTSEVSLSMAEEALEELTNRIRSLETELHDAKFQNRVSNEKIRLSELTPQPSSLASRTDESHRMPNSRSQLQFLSAFDR